MHTYMHMVPYNYDFLNENDHEFETYLGFEFATKVVPVSPEKTVPGSTSVYGYICICISNNCFKKNHKLSRFDFGFERIRRELAVFFYFSDGNGHDTITIGSI